MDLRDLLDRADLPADLRQSVAEALSGHARGQQALAAAEAALVRRERALRCLHALAESLTTPSASPSDILQRALDLLPSAFSDPARTVAHLVLPDQEYRAGAVGIPAVLLSRPVIVRGEEVGRLEIGLVGAAAPFEEDEEQLLTVAARRAGTLLEQWDAEVALRAALDQTYVDRMRALQELTLELSRSAAVDDLCRRAVELGRERLGFDRMSIWFAGADPGLIQGSFGVDEAGRLRDERGVCRVATLQSLISVLANQVRVVSREDTELRDEHGQTVGRGWLAHAALWDGERVIGALCTDNLLSQQPLAPGQPELLALYASALGHLLSRLRAEQAVRTSELLYRTTIDAMSDAIHVVDRDLRIVLANDVTAGWAEQFGSAPPDVVGCRLFEVFPFLPETVREEYEAVFRTGEPVVTTETTLFGEREVLTETRKIPVFEDGHVVRVITAIRDVTEQRRAAAALRESQEQFTAFMDHLPAAAFIKDEQSRTLYVNQYLRDLLDAGAWLGGPPGDPVPPDTVAAMLADDARALAQGGVVVEERIPDKSGAERWFQTTKFPIHRQGEPPLLGGISLDITERREAEAALRSRLAFEALVARLATEFINLPAARLNEGINRALQAVGELLEADRAYVFLFRQGAERMDNTHEWCAPGATPEKDNLQGIQLDEELPLYAEAIRRREPFRVPVVAELPAEAAAERLEFRRQAIQSLICVPMVAHDELIGFLGLDAVRAPRDWSDDTVRLLGVVGTVIANALERKRAEEVLRESEERYRLLFERAPVGIFHFDQSGQCVHCNDEAARMMGATREQLQHSLRADLLLDRRASAELQKALAGGGTGYFDDWYTATTTGRRIWLRAYAYTVPGEDGRPGGAIVLAQELTEQRRAEEERERLEAQLQQAQKLESLGVLAGGVAHDFNNILMGVLGNASLALMQLTPDAPAREFVQQIENAGLRAADLANQMLAYSGKGAFVVQPLNLSHLVEEMSHLLASAIPGKVTLRRELAMDLPSVQADATQLRQVVLNLITNAAEAIGDQEGVVVVRTAVVEAGRECLANTYVDDQLPAGRYVCLEVTDTGVGMDEETQARIFEPFYTTKFTGRGLGLAGVLGIVRGHKGAISVSSRPGEGTTITVLLPCADAPAVAEAPAAPAEAEPVTGHGTVLVVDDEEAVRLVARTALQAAGYEVLVAADGHEGVEVLRGHADEVAIVLLDLTMPRLGGQEALDAMRAIRPDVPVILSSGFSAQEAAARFGSREVAGFLQKPYRASQLVERIGQALSG